MLELEVSLLLSHVVDTCDAGDKLIPDQDWIKQETFDRRPDSQVSSCPLNLDFVPDPEAGFLTDPLTLFAGDQI